MELDRRGDGGRAWHDGGRGLDDGRRGAALTAEDVDGPRQQANRRWPAATSGYSGGCQQGQHHRKEEETVKPVGSLAGVGERWS